MIGEFFGSGVSHSVGFWFIGVSSFSWCSVRSMRSGLLLLLGKVLSCVLFYCWGA